MTIKTFDICLVEFWLKFKVNFAICLSLFTENINDTKKDLK